MICFMKKYKKVKKNNGNYMETEHEIILAIKKEAEEYASNNLN